VTSSPGGNLRCRCIKDLPPQHFPRSERVSSEFAWRIDKNVYLRAASIDLRSFVGPAGEVNSLFRLVPVILDFLQDLVGLFEGAGVLLFPYFFFARFIAHCWSSRYSLTLKMVRANRYLCTNVSAVPIAYLTPKLVRLEVSEFLT
jgi:hypothetical protein